MSERNRLRSECWRRAHGIMPRKPAQRPWLAEGISRSTYYRRRKQVPEAGARQCALASVERTIERAESYAAKLSRDLDRCTALKRDAWRLSGNWRRLRIHPRVTF